MKDIDTNNKVIFIAPNKSSFINNDIALLKKHYDVVVNIYRWNLKILIPFYMFHQLFFIFTHIYNTKSIVISFGGYWAILPTLLGKIFKTPVFLILNGTDCASIPSLNYGNLRKPILRRAIKFSYKHATILLPVSHSLIKTKNEYYGDANEYYQGYLHFFPDIKTKNIILNNGVDSKFWEKEKGIDKELNSFISVFSLSQFYLKGGDLILKVAEKFPQCKFYICGCERPELQKQYPNVFFLGKLSPVELKYYYSISRFHLQLSVFEGFGLAMCEAMLCEAVPIGSSVNIIPEIIGNTGFVVNKKDPLLLESIIKKALSNTTLNVMGKNARKRIMSNYNMKKREETIVNIINSY